MNTATFRIIHFLPNPFLGGGIPIGAMVDIGATRKLVVSPNLPRQECIGSAYWMLQTVLGALANVPRNADVRATIGPHVDCGPARTVVDADPEAWVANLLDQSALRPKTTAEKPGVGNPHRATRGMQFLDTLQVKEYVKSKFMPEKCLADHVGFLPPVSHWAGDSTGHGVLLLEPIVLGYGKGDGGAEAIEKQFEAYRYVAAHEKAFKAQLGAYFVPSVPTAELQRMQREITGALSAVCMVYDGYDDVARSRLAADVKRFGALDRLALT